LGGRSAYSQLALSAGSTEVVYRRVRIFLALWGLLLLPLQPLVHEGLDRLRVQRPLLRLMMSTMRQV
jgi:hypothetical protein